MGPKKLNSRQLIKALKRGRFPMAESSESVDIQWRYPYRRGVIPIEEFYLSKRNRRYIRKIPYTVKVDENFRKVMESCADREETWINKTILDVFTNLFEEGFAHSLEIYDDNGELSGGLYGVALGSVFFSESLFHYKPHMDKIALLECHKILEKNGYTLWDHQFYTPYLEQFGCVRMWRWKYRYLLRNALKQEAKFEL